MIPGATEQAFLQQVAAQLGLSEAPQPAAQVEGSRATWNVYEPQNLGQVIAVAIVEHEGDLLVVQLATPPLRHEPYYEQAFVPAVEAFEAGAVPPATAGASPTPSP